MSGRPAPGQRSGARSARPQPHRKHLAHGTEVGVRGIGATEAAAFEQAAPALTAVIADPPVIEPREAVAMTCEGADDRVLPSSGSRRCSDT